MEEKYKETHCSHYNNPQTNRKQHPTSYWRYNATDRTELDYPYHVGSSLSSGQMIDSSPTFVRNKKKNMQQPQREEERHETRPKAWTVTTPKSSMYVNIYDSYHVNITPG